MSLPSVGVFESTKQHEEFREVPYPDSKGLWTVGIGRCVETNPLTGSEWAYLLASKLIKVTLSEDGAEWLMSTQLSECQATIARRFSWFAELSQVRQDILVEMYYQMGPGFFTFNDMFEALAKHDYAQAAKHGLNSKWAKKDSPRRAREMMKRMESGE